MKCNDLRDGHCEDDEGAGDGEQGDGHFPGVLRDGLSGISGLSSGLVELPDDEDVHDGHRHGGDEGVDESGKEGPDNQGIVGQRLPRPAVRRVPWGMDWHPGLEMRNVDQGNTNHNSQTDHPCPLQCEQGFGFEWKKYSDKSFA